MSKRKQAARTRPARHDVRASAAAIPWQAYACLAVGIAFTSYVRWRYLQLPLERDEGEFGYIAQNILRGASPFEAYIYKLPGVPYFYALFMGVFGQTIAAIHLALLGANLGTSLILFFCARRLMNSYGAAFAAVTYSLFSLDYTVLGTAAHATQFVNLFLVAGLWLLLRPARNLWSVSAAGLMMGMAFIMKQPALLFVLFGALLLLSAHWTDTGAVRIRTLTRMTGYALGAVVPYLMLVLIAIRHGHFDLFWKWTVTYPALYISTISPNQGWENFAVVSGEIVGRFPLLWCASAVGFAVLVLSSKLEATNRIAVAGLSLLSFLAIVPGYYFHHHYFILLLPAASICVGGAFVAIPRLYGRKISAAGFLSAALFIALAGWGIGAQRGFYFTFSNDGYESFRYGNNPFREAVAIADYIRSITTEDDRILVLGSEAEIYYYAKRKAASGYLFVHGLVANHSRNLEMQRELIAEAERNRPEAMVLCGVQYSWLKQPDTPDDILHWFERYSSGFDIVGMVDMLPGGTKYRWGADAAVYTPQADNYLVVYKRKKAD